LKKGNQGEGGGRPIAQLSLSQVETLEGLAAVLTKRQIADFFDISENTLRAIEERQPEVSAAYKKGKAQAIVGVAQNLIQQAEDGNVTAAIFYLKTQAGWSETLSEQRDIPQMNIILTHDTD
jgi:hypothetical protein